MKQFKTWMAAVLLGLLSFSCFAQEANDKQPRWVSDKGYWVVESNAVKGKDHIIRFYNNDNVMIYKETLTGVKLKPARRSVQLKLKKVLEQSALAWQKARVAEEEKSYVVAILK